MATGVFSQSRTTSSEWSGTAKLRHRKSISWPTTRGGDVSERNLMEVTIASNEIQFFVIRNSKLAGPRRSASQWINWHRKTTLIAHLLREISEKLVYLTEQIRKKCTDETPIRLPNSSDNYEPSPPRTWRGTTWTNPFSSIPKVAFVFFQYFMVTVEWKPVELIFWICCSKIVDSWCQSAATDGRSEQNTLTRHIFSYLRACLMMSFTTLAQGVSARHTIHVSCACVFDLSSTLSHHSWFVSPIFCFILLIFHFIFEVDRFRVKPMVRFREWGVWPFGQQRSSHRLWAQLFRDQWRVDQCRSLHHCSLRSVKKQDAVDKTITLLKNACKSVVVCRSCGASEKIQVAAQKRSKSGFFRNDKESRFSLTVKQRFENTSSTPIMTVEVSISWMKWSSLNKDRLIVLLQETNDFDEINNFFHEQLLEQNRDLREAHMKSLTEMEELKRFQGSTFDTFSRRKLVGDRDTIREFRAKIQELQNEVNWKNDSRDVGDADSVRSGQYHVASQPVCFSLHPDLGGMLSRPLGMPSRNDGPPSIWDTHGITGNVFANPTALFLQ